MRVPGPALETSARLAALLRRGAPALIVALVSALTLYRFLAKEPDHWVLGILLLTTSGACLLWGMGHVVAHRRLHALLALARTATGERTAHHRSSDAVEELDYAVTRLAQTLRARQQDLALHQTQLSRLNRMCAMSDGIGNIMRHARDRDAICKSICRLVVEQGGFRFSWIGLCEPDAQELQINWHAGDRSGSLEPLRLGLHGGSLPIIAVIGTGQIVSCNNLAHDATFAHAHDPALAREVGACAFLPLKTAGEVTAILGLYAEETDFFDDEEAAALEKLAEQMSLCFDHVDKGEALHHLAYYDALTELPNRVLYADRLDQALARAHYNVRHVAVIMVQIDRFKEINTVHGYQAGDAVLQEVARRLMQAVRLGDTVARTGSSAFGLVLTDVSQPADAALVARNITQAFEPPIVVADHELYITLGLGIAVSPGDGQDTETLLRNATAALHMIERESSTRYSFYTPELDLRARERFSIERELHRALDRNELAVHYQPIIDLQSGAVIGSEALLRWHNAELGSVSPANFIPVAEKTGLIVPIGDWVLQTAYRQARQWEAAGLPQRICVNASAIQLRESDFEERTQAILAEAGADPCRALLTLEITESNLMENAEHTASRLSRLRDQGMTISIDDFGTGYSSLSYLKRLPVDFLKIDLSFIRDLTHSPEDAAIIKAIIILAHSLNLAVIAEGVETPEQLALLREFGCNAAQGYLFSPALPPEEFETFCRTRVGFVMSQ